MPGRPNNQRRTLRCNKTVTISLTIPETEAALFADATRLLAAILTDETIHNNAGKTMRALANAALELHLALAEATNTLDTTDSNEHVDSGPLP